MVNILHSDEFRAKSGTATIKAQRYIDPGFGPWVLWRIIVKRDDDERGRIIDKDLTRCPTDRRIKRICERY